MKRLQTAAMVLLAGAFAGSTAAHNVTVTAGEQPLLQTPVTTLIPKDLVGKSVRLTADGKEVPLQTDELDGQPAVTWIVDELAAKSSLSFALEEGQPTTSDKGVTLTKTADGLEIKIDGELFTVYRTKDGPKPYCWPIIGPTGKPVTRAFPMVKGVKGEPWDHHHHRSLWFTHGKIGGSDFWSETPTSAKTVHTDFEKIVSGPVFGEFVSKVDWLSRKGEKVCEDVRRIRVYRTPGSRLFDYQIRLKASEKDLLIGDDKEGTFGFRVAGTMGVDQPSGKPKGTLVNANGDKDGKAWGKRAPWADYSGPVDGEIVGIAIFDSPTNFRHPTYWHARTYGLFTANPFGLSFFTGDKKNNGSHTIEKGKELNQLYRCYIHRGGAAEGKVAEHYADFSHPPVVKVE